MTRQTIARRTFLKTTLASALATPFIARPRAASAAESLVVVNYGGPIADAKKKVFYDPFTQETGIPITMVSGPDFAKVRAQVESQDVEWDMVDLISSVLPLGDRLNLFEPIDESVVRRDGMIDEARREFAIGNYVFAGGIGYATQGRENAPARHPATWEEFWAVEDIPGRRALRNRIEDTLEIALMADGVPASEVYPCDVERAFKSLDRIKPHISHWISQQAQTVPLIQQNECDFNYIYSNQVLVAQQANIPVGYVDRQNLLGVGFATILKGTRNKEAAMQLAGFMLRPDRQVALANITGMAPVFPELLNEVAADVKGWLPDLSDPGHLVSSADWWSDNVEKLTLRFQEWVRT